MRLPEWARTERRGKPRETKRVLRSVGLATVCEEARCPNIGLCFSKPSAAFIIMGPNCTRNCRFCAVTHALPEPLKNDEPQRVGLAASALGLRYVVITSVTRDDLPDGGAEHFARTVRAARRRVPAAKVEVLTPDFRGSPESVAVVVGARPDVFNHNVETVPRLYPAVRPQADYRRSLSVLHRAASLDPSLRIKSGLMLGLGERIEEVLQVMMDLREAGCEFLTLGQYLRPSRAHAPVERYIDPAEFDDLRHRGLAMGFRQVLSGPLVRSSKDAEEMYNRGHPET